MSDYKNLTVVNVYEHAEAIGREFEKIIDRHGVDNDIITDLMPKVIRVLEYLEHLVAAKEEENTDMLHLKEKLQELQLEKSDLAFDDVRHSKALRAQEQQWAEENAELTQSVTRLQQENKRLVAVLEVCHVKEDKIKETAEREFEVMIRLKETVDKQRAELRQAKRDVHDKQMDIEAMAARVERLMKTTSELRNKHQLTQRQATNLIAEKTDLEAAIHEREKQLTEMMSQVSRLRLEAGECSAELKSAPAEPQATDSVDSSYDLGGKVLIDPRDPNRPRFTMAELRQVLLERNELKAKLLEIEDELHHSKDESTGEETSCSCSGEHNARSVAGAEKTNKASGVRRFFRSIFSSGDQRSRSSTFADDKNKPSRHTDDT